MYTKNLAKIFFCGMFLVTSQTALSDGIPDDRSSTHKELARNSAQVPIANMPTWMLETPVSDHVIYQSGSALSSNLSMSRAKARNMAYGQICVTAGGTVNQRNETFVSDSGSNSVESSELAIRSVCSTTDITGAEIVEEEVLMEDSRYRTYVLVGLPIGEANILREQKVQENLSVKALERADEVFEDMENQSEN